MHCLSVGQKVRCLVLSPQDSVSQGVMLSLTNSTDNHLSRGQNTLNCINFLVRLQWKTGAIINFLFLIRLTGSCMLVCIVPRSSLYIHFIRTYPLLLWWCVGYCTICRNIGRLWIIINGNVKQACSPERWESSWIIFTDKILPHLCACAINLTVELFAMFHFYAPAMKGRWRGGIKHSLHMYAITRACHSTGFILVPVWL